MLDELIARVEAQIADQHEVVIAVAETSSAYASGFQQGKLEQMQSELRYLKGLRDREKVK